MEVEEGETISQTFDLFNHFPLSFNYPNVNSYAQYDPDISNLFF